MALVRKKQKNGLKKRGVVIKVAEYHIGAGAFGIYAGTLNSKNKTLWQNKSDCTDEALCAVRDYMVLELLGGIENPKTNEGGYVWTLSDGREVELRVSIRNSPKSEVLNKLK